MEHCYLPNFSYLFVPFTTEKMDDFHTFCKHITPQSGWMPVQMDNRYLHRYVAERITNPENTADNSFRLDPVFAERKDLFLGTKQYRTAPKIFADEKIPDSIFKSPVWKCTHSIQAFAFWLLNCVSLTMIR